MSAYKDFANLGERIAIVMPALNEEAAISHHVRAIAEHSAIRALPIERLIVVDELPATKVGKIDKKALRADIAARLARD